MISETPLCNVEMREKLANKFPESMLPNIERFDKWNRLMRTYIHKDIENRQEAKVFK